MRYPFFATISLFQVSRKLGQLMLGASGEDQDQRRNSRPGDQFRLGHEFGDEVCQLEDLCERGRVGFRPASEVNLKEVKSATVRSATLFDLRSARRSDTDLLFRPEPERPKLHGSLQDLARFLATRPTQFRRPCCVFVHLRERFARLDVRDELLLLDQPQMILHDRHPSRRPSGRELLLSLDVRLACVQPPKIPRRPSGRW